MDEIQRTQHSKTLSMWLRHKPERGGLTLSKDGWVGIDSVLAAFARQGQPLSRPELDDMLRVDVKGRFEVEGGRIRARYGHSVELEEQPHPGMPPATLYHGTAKRFVPKIMEMGLRPMKRQYVHLSPDRATAREVGKRRDQEPAILIVAAHDAHAAGIQFYPRGKGIWMSDPIPPQYLTLWSPRQENSPPAAKPQTDIPSASAGRPLPAGLAARKAAPGEPRRRRPKGGFMRRER
jgi:putative RNA 2'-phosphotransferase